MGVSSDFESELIRLSLIDYFSGQVLIDRLVRPNVPMQHMNTRYSGVTRQDIQNAIRNRTCILGGLEEARKEVWKFVGPQTVVVGHSVANDLSALRWIHERCVDSFVVEEGVRKKIKAKEEEEEKEKEKVREKQKEERLLEISLHCGPGMAEETRRMMEEQEEIKGKVKVKKMRGKRGEDGMSLKALTKKKLGRVIQDGGKKGHDSVEDAVATRDLIHFHILGLMQKDREKKEAEREVKREAEAAFVQVLAEGTRDAEMGSVFAAFP